MNTETKEQPTNAIESSTLLERLARWIVNNPPQYGGDHACSLCYPHSDILVEGFVCAYHEAVKIVECSNARVERHPQRRDYE